MQVEQKQILPWTNLKERWMDLDWIMHNLIVFAPAATAGHREFGRGALIVDTSPGNENETCPCAYFSQEEIGLYEGEDINQMIAAYDPLEELVIILLKGEQRSPSYRVRTMPDLR